MDVTIIVATFGDLEWMELARDRAIRSAHTQDVPVIYVHGLALHDARNAGLAQARSEFVVFLDADDELAPGYVTAMTTGTADVRAPAVQYVLGRPRPPYVPRVAGHEHDCAGACLVDGNYIAIGAAVRTSLLRSVGGFEPWDLYEDWAAWARCWRAGATVETISSAVYIAHVRHGSRNRAPGRAERDAAHWAIHEAIWPDRLDRERVGC